MRPDIAVRAWKIRCGSPPSRRVRLLARNVTRDSAPSKLPHANAGAPPFDGHDGAAGIVELGSKGRRALLDGTAGVVVGAVVAVFLVRLARLLALHAHGAAAGGVEGHGVSGGPLVDGLHDVDFAVVGPV